MMKLVPAAICLLISTFASVLPDPPLRAGEPPMKAGFAEADITPEIGMEVPGGYGKSYCRSIHDPCKVRAAVFDDGRTRVALVGVDAGFVYRPMVLQARELIRQRCGIRPEAVLVGASHSHSSGPLGIVQPRQYDHASEFVRRLAYEKSSCADAKYVDKVRDMIVEAVCAADRTKVEARCGAGTGKEDRVAFNRRLRMKNGMIYTHPGQNNPDVLDYAGPTDPTVGVLGAWEGSGKLLGCVVNFGCHATTSPNGISQAIQLGPVVLLANPGELFCQYSVETRQRSPFPITFPVGYANDFAGYVPTEEAFGPHGGGYETRLTSCSNLEAQAGRRMVETALELARQMKPGDEPKPKIAPVGKPWTYGNVPPELN